MSERRKRTVGKDTRSRFVLRLALCTTAAGAAFVLPAVAHAAGATYYVSATGSDSAPGTTPALAWRSLARVNSATLLAGDRVLLEGGSIFPGTVKLGAGEQGTAAAPISLSSYGTGRATIAAGDGDGIKVYDAAGVSISNLSVVGPGAASSQGDGISFYNDLPGDVKLPFIRIKQVEVYGFERGISIGGWSGGSGFTDVRVTGSQLHDNRHVGLTLWGPPYDPAGPTYANGDVYVGNVSAYANAGDPADLVHNSGSGITLGSVRNGTVEHSAAYGNGALCRAPEGGAGIWAYDSTAVTFRYDRAYGNKAGGTADGDGFDLDQNTSDSLIEYSTAHDNDGAGFLLWGGTGSGHHGNTIRFNTSRNDGRKNGYGGLMGGGQITDDELYSNTVTIAKAASGKPAAVVFRYTGAGEVSVHDNELDTRSVPFVFAPALQLSALAFRGNSYQVLSGSSAFVWGDQTYAGLPAWQTATGQEPLAP